MDATSVRVFPMTVNLPRSYMGKGELRVGPESVTLVARPIRHHRAIAVAYVCVVLVVMAIVLVAVPGSLEIRSLLVGVIAAVLAGGTLWFLRSLGGESRSMSLPLAAVSVAKRNGRVLVLGATFDSHVRSGHWTLVADTRDDAETIASALTTGSG